MASWYVYSGAGGAGTGADWANAYTTLAAALTAKAAGDTFFVAQNHAETQASALTLTSPGISTNPCFVYCVNQAGSVPPVSADLRTTATITTTGSSFLSVYGCAYFYGINFSASTGANNSSFAFGDGSHDTIQTYKNCSFAMVATSNGRAAYIGAGTTANRVVFDNTTFSFGGTGQYIQPQVGDFIWKNTPSAIVGATLPTTLINWAFNWYPSNAYLEGVDLSALGSGKTICGAIPAQYNATANLKDCKLGASVTVAATPTSGTGQILVSRTDSAGTNYIEQKYNFTGTQVNETVIVMTGGATNGTTPESRKITTTANSKWAFPFEAVPIGIWNNSTSAANATLYGIWNAAALPNNDDVWFNVEYLGSNTSPLGSFASGTKADGLAAGVALTASTQAWDSLVTARANTTAYTLGQVIKVASNPGRIFFCTTAGTTAGSEPAGYASAVDGGSVTDNSAVFRAGMRFQETVSFTAGQVGTIYAYIYAAKASSTWYIDPLVVLS